MVDPEVRKTLLMVLGISPQALSQRAKTLKKKYGPMSSEDAVYVIAHVEGIDLSRFLPLAIQDRIRTLVPRELQATVKPKKAPRVPRGAKRRKPKAIPYPLVDPKTIEAANFLGANVFPQVFILENSIRALIEATLSKLDIDWWNKYVPTEVRNNVASTIKKEKRYPYRRSRGVHPLFYSNFAVSVNCFL